MQVPSLVMVFAGVAVFLLLCQRWRRRRTPSPLLFLPAVIMMVVFYAIVSLGVLDAEARSLLGRPLLLLLMVAIAADSYNSIRHSG